MIGSVLRVTVTTACIILAMLLPFLPGRYDSLAVGVSLIAQLIGTVGLLVVPIGALWMTSEYVTALGWKRYAFAVTALVASSLVWVLISLLAMTESLSLGLFALGLGASLLMRIWPRLASPTSEPPARGGAIPLGLTIVPTVVALIQFTLDDRITEFSRSRAIRNSAQLIADIEAHRVANGRYPPSVMSVSPDYLPSVIGIKEYRYEPSGDSYNVMFEQPSFRFGTREIVMYNPKDQQDIASHDNDVIRLTAEQLALERRRGYYAVHDAAQPHWKYLWFD